jgi:hypothetical protein
MSNKEHSDYSDVYCLLQTPLKRPKIQTSNVPFSPATPIIAAEPTAVDLPKLLVHITLTNDKAKVVKALQQIKIICDCNRYDSKSTAEYFACLGGYTTMVVVMKKWQQSTAWPCVEILDIMVIESRSSLKSIPFVELGLFEALIDALDFVDVQADLGGPSSDVARKVRLGLHLLCNMITDNAKNIDHFVLRLDGLTTVVTTMNSYAMNPEVLILCANILFQASRYNDSYCEQIVAAGGMHALSDALKNHLRHACLIEATRQAMNEIINNYRMTLDGAVESRAPVRRKFY